MYMHIHIHTYINNNNRRKRHYTWERGTWKEFKRVKLGIAGQEKNSDVILFQLTTYLINIFGSQICIQYLGQICFLLLPNVHSKVLLNITTHQSLYIKKYSMIMKSDLCICQLLFLELKSSQQSAYSWVLIVFYLFIVTLSCLWKRQPINLSREIVLQLTPQYV